MPSNASTLEIHRTDQVIIASFRERLLLDHDELRRVEQALLAEADAVPGSKVIVDFKDVQGLASKMLEVLLRVHQTLSASGGELVLCGLAARLREVFEVTQLSQLLVIYEDRDQALAAVGRSC